MGKVLIAGISGVRNYFDSIHSWENMKRRPGDKMYHQAINIGEVGRTIAIDKFLKEKEFDAIFMCDLDQIFSMDALEILRSHDKDMISGHYMQRRTSTLLSNWAYSPDGGWPYIPYLYRDIPKDGMHRLANTGLGCVLIKREPIEAVKKYLDHWEPNSNPFEIGKVPEEDVRFGNWGSDWRFFYYAQRLGFELWGDASIETPHAVNNWITRDFHKQFEPNPEKDAKLLNERVFLMTIRSQGSIDINALVARKLAIEGILNEKPFNSKEYDHAFMSGQLAEVQMWIDALSAESPPPGFVERWHRDPQPALEGAPVQFPTFKTREELENRMANPEQDIGGQSSEQSGADRETATRNAAMKVANMVNEKQEILKDNAAG